MTGFVIIAGLMVLVALAFIVLPLLRARRGVDPAALRRRALDQALASGVISGQEFATKLVTLQAGDSASTQRSRTAFVALLLVVLIVPALAIFIYSRVGTPSALDPDTLQPATTDAGAGIDMDQAVAGLAAKLEKDPNDAQGWALLGRAYQAMQKPTEALDAIKRAHELSPDDADLMAEYAQALVMGGGRDFSGEPKQLLDRALSIQPDNQRALWLSGVAQYQAGQYPESIATWTRLLGVLPEDSPVAASVQAQIDDARGKAGMPASAASVANGAAAQDQPTISKPDSSTKPRLTVSVQVAPSIAKNVDPGMTVFVYARAASGPPMPLAIQRLTVAQLPLTVTLDDSNGMMPSMKLSDFPHVVIGARISRSGDPIAKRGDWQTLSAPVDVQQREAITLVIDQVVP